MEERRVAIYARVSTEHEATNFCFGEIRYIGMIICSSFIQTGNFSNGISTRVSQELP